MQPVFVQFTYFTGIKADLFAAARLKGSWDAAGRRSGDWSTHGMECIVGFDRCCAFMARIPFDPQGVGSEFEWGVELDHRNGQSTWAIMTEEGRLDSMRRVRAFSLVAPQPAWPQHEFYYLNHSRRLGAQKYYRRPSDSDPAIRFAVWAPNATAVDVVMATLWRDDD